MEMVRGTYIEERWLWEEQPVSGSPGLKWCDPLPDFLCKDNDQHKLQWIDMIRFFVGWLNDAAVKYGGRQVLDYNSVFSTDLTKFSFCRSMRGDEGRENFGHISYHSFISLSDLDILLLLIQARYGIDISAGADEAQVTKKVDEFLYSRDW
jgi:hypothetical protein